MRSLWGIQTTRLVCVGSTVRLRICSPQNLSADHQFSRNEEVSLGRVRKKSMSWCQVQHSGLPIQCLSSHLKPPKNLHIDWRTCTRVQLRTFLGGFSWSLYLHPMDEQKYLERIPLNQVLLITLNYQWCFSTLVTKSVLAFPPHLSYPL